MKTRPPRSFRPAPLFASVARALTAPAAAMALLALPGCANLNTVHHKFAFDGAGEHRMRAVSIDANQRFLTATYGAALDGDAEAWRACAEPSPDGLAVFSGALSTSASNDQVGAEVAASVAAQAASIGLRTQSITLLRDAQYRLCEAYINGALTGRQMATLHRRFQNVMVANLAIEQLTGYARPTIVTVGAGAAASAAGGLRAAQEALDTENQELKQKQAAADKAKTTADAAAADNKAKQDLATAAKAQLPPNANTLKTDAANARAQADADRGDAVAKRAIADKAKEASDPNAAALETAAKAAETKAAASLRDYQLKQAASDAVNKPADDADKAAADAKAAFDKANAALKAALAGVEESKANIEALEEARDAARGLTASATPAAPGTVVSPAPSAAATDKIAQAVKDIVELVLKQDLVPDACLDYLTSLEPPIDPKDPVLQSCVARINLDDASKVLSPRDLSRVTAAVMAVEPAKARSFELKQQRLREASEARRSRGD